MRFWCVLGLNTQKSISYEISNTGCGVGLGIESKKTTKSIFQKHVLIRKINQKCIFLDFLWTFQRLLTTFYHFCYNGISKSKNILHFGKKPLCYTKRLKFVEISFCTVLMQLLSSAAIFVLQAIRLVYQIFDYTVSIS